MFKDINSSQTIQKTSCIENASEIVIYKMTPTSEKAEHYSRLLLNFHKLDVTIKLFSNKDPL